MKKIDWIRKLTSRKLWLAISVFVTDILVLFKVPENTITQVCALIMSGAAVVAYIIAEGLADAAHAEAEPTVIYVPTDEFFDENGEEEEHTEEVHTEEGGEG